MRPCALCFLREITGLDTALLKLSKVLVTFTVYSSQNYLYDDFLGRTENAVNLKTYIAFSFGYSPSYRAGSLPKEQQDSTTETTNKIKNTMTEIICLFCLIWHIHLEVFRFEVTIFKFFGAFFFFFKHSRLAWFGVARSVTRKKKNTSSSLCCMPCYPSSHLKILRLIHVSFV